MLRITIICLIAICFYCGCQEKQPLEYDLEGLLNAYLNAWNTGDMESLDTIASETFELRMNPTFQPVQGIDSLKIDIMKTREAFRDFTIYVKEKSSAGTNVCLITWEIVAHKKSDGQEMRVDGFSVIFHADGKVTGEWIGYSDLTWVKEFGYRILPPE